MTLGFKALQFSANAALEEEQKETPKEEQLKFSGWLAAVNIAISLGFFIACTSSAVVCDHTAETQFRHGGHAFWVEPGGWRDSHYAVSDVYLFDVEDERHPSRF